MSIPSLTLDIHAHYTPELRDKVLEKLTVPLPATEYLLPTPELLRALADTVSTDQPVLSLYLQLTPERRVGGAWRTVLSSLSDAMLKQINDRRLRQTLQDEFAQIEQAMEDELPELGRGVAFFVCRQLGLWQQIAVPLPLPDGVHRGPHPYVRPLARTQDEHDSFAIALLSKKLSRFFVARTGLIQEVFNVNDTAPGVVPVDHDPKDHHSGPVMQLTRDEARVLAHVAELVLKRYEARYLLLAEAPDLRAAVIRDLDKDVQPRIGAEISVYTHARPAEVAAAAEPAQRAIEEREELATVHRVLDAGPQRSAWGVQAALVALWEHRVATLVVDDMFARPGARCPECAALLEPVPDTCPVCGNSKVEPVEDVVELAIEQTLDEDGAFEMVRSESARQSLSQIGPMAALLRW